MTGRRRDLPAGVVANPRLSRWVSIAPDGTVRVRVGKVELGQGILTALAQLAADELDVDLAQIRMEPASTDEGPDEGLTAGSRSIEESGAALRQICAEVRALLLAEAVTSGGLDPATVTVRGGVVGDASGRRIGYAELAVDLDRDAAGSARPKADAGLRLAGTSVQRLDLPDKIAGRPRFIQDLMLEGQLYGRVLRPPSPGATLAEAGTAAAAQLPGTVSVVRDGSFLGVVALDEEAAERAVAALRETAHWRERDTLPDEDDLPGYLRAAPADTFTVDESGLGRTDQIVERMTASYSRPFLAHASMAPSCGAARWHGDEVEVWSHSQGIYRLRWGISQALGLDERNVTVRHVQGAGAYGHNGADDAAFDAVLLARSVPGRPVHVLWSRADELTWAPFGPAMVAELQAGLDAGGKVVTWSHEVWSQGHFSRPGYAGSPGLLAAAHLERPIEAPPAADPPPSAGGGTARGAIPLYTFPERRIRAHRVLSAPLRSSALRGLGSFLNVFAIESFMDELALAAGQDPLDYRLAQLADPRARDVLRAAAELGRWGAESAGGRGIGFARYKGRGAYCAVVAEVEAVHEVRVRRLAIAVDVGRVVNPDGVRNQIEGGAVQATSWTLKERVRFDRRHVTSADWESYPILRFGEVPEVEVEILSRPGEPSVGAGEAAQGPTAAAIGNAVAAALGLRVRDLPLTSERIMSAIGE